MLFQFFSVLSYIHTLLVCLRLGRTWLGFHYERREWLGLISASNSRKKGPKEWADKAHAIPKYLLVGIKHNKLKDEGGDNTIPLTYSPNFSSITHCSLYVLEDDKAAPLFAIPMPISYMFYTHPLLLSLLRMLFLSGALPVMWCCWCSPHLNFTSDTNVINEDAIIRDRSNESYCWAVSLTSKIEFVFKNI